MTRTRLVSSIRAVLGWLAFAVIANGTSHAQCLRWGPEFGVSGAGMDSPIFCAQAFQDPAGAALYVGGQFTSAGGLPAINIARWDGHSWSNVGSGTGPGNQAWVLAMTVFDDGSGPALYAGGYFTQMNGIPAMHVAKWDGNSWSALGGGVGVVGLDEVVIAMAVHDDGSGPALYVGGQFTTASGVPVLRIARWDGQSWSSVGGGFYGPSFPGCATLLSVPTPAGQRLIAGGHFQFAGGATVNSIAAWDGQTWSSLGSGFSSASNAVTSALAYDPSSGFLYAGGHFDHAGGAPASNIARWDGASWSTVGSTGLTHPSAGVVYALALYDDGSRTSLYAGGQFSLADTLPAQQIARWDGNAWSSVGGGLETPGSTAVVYGFGSFDGGRGLDLFPVGWFSVAGGSTPSSHISRWEGCHGPGVLTCAGDGLALGVCPCSNSGQYLHGCENSAGTGGALLYSNGATSPDSVVLHTSGELPTALSMFLQGDSLLAPVAFGDGLRCAGGMLKRLYAKSCVGGSASAPSATDPSITARSSQLGDTIPPGSTRAYQVYYRDPAPAFCAAPQGATWNITNAVVIHW
jgi:hypothetical protein